jgi:DNA processing protein
VTATASSAERKALVVLSGLARMGPRRLRALIVGDGAEAALGQLRRGRYRPTPEVAAACAPEDPRKIVHTWTEGARAADVEERWAAHAAHGITVLVPGDPAWSLDEDPDPPSVLFCLGRLDLLDPEAPRVAVIGTRRCTAYGIEVAGDLGEQLAAAGVSVVSGLAAGIDGAAHVGAMRGSAPAAPPIGVAATGLDVVYPRHHKQLWRRIAASGLLLAEVPLGTPPARWRFPARNRIIAAVSRAVVVVESGATGGSLHTVDDAVRRDRPVLAVPGPVTSAASSGTNRLLADGAVPACDVLDVLGAIGLPVARRRRRAPADPEPDRTPSPSAAASRVLDALGWRAATIDQLLLRTGLDLGATSLLVAELEGQGLVRAEGGWLERKR